MRRPLAAFAAGLAGAAVLALLNRYGTTIHRRAPRTDRLREAGLAAFLRELGVRRPSARKLHRLARTWDVLGNSAFYAMLFAGRPRPWRRGLLGGALVGLFAGLLAPALGVVRGREARIARPLTVAWYLGAGLTSSAIYRALAPQRTIEPGIAVPRTAM
jgi:hypothetical protein